MAVLSNKNNAVIKLLLIVLLISRGATDEEEFTADELSKIFQLLRNTGNARLQEEKQNEDSKHVIETTNQYLVTAVMSHEELKFSRKWEDIPNTVNINVYFNKKLQDCKKQVGKKPTHGEVLCLQYENQLEEMISLFKVDHDEDVMPFVVMYSVYIPCALIKGIEYSCAEELGMDALINFGLYKMIVGFEAIFDNTDPEAAIEMLCNGGIDVYQLTNNNEIKLYQIGLQPSGSPPIVLFQDQFLKAMKEAPLGQCLEDCKHIEFTEDFLVCYVDALTYYCTQENKGLKDMLTEYSRQAFLERAKEFTADHTDNSCGMHGEVSKYWIEFCVIQALQSSTTIGAQRRDKTTDDSEHWDLPPFGAKWGKLYQFDPELRFPKAYCTQNVIGVCKSVTKSGRFAERNFVRLADKAKVNTRHRKPK